MRTVAHVSDLHFGRVQDEVVGGIEAALARIAPDLLVVSGDLTQRARPREFEAARAFLDRLPYPKLVVPGNHDVPLHNPWARWRTPLAGFRRWISEDLEPFYLDSELAVVGVNTARSLVWKGGRISGEQVERSCRRLESTPAEVTRIIVTHHPFDLPPPYRPRHLVRRAQMAISAFATCRVDLFLAGHWHASHAGETSARYPIPGYSALVIAAGTATSLRTRREANSWNLLRIDQPRVEVERYSWDAQGGFRLAARLNFHRDKHGWRLAA